MNNIIKIIATGGYLPNKIISNDELSKKLDTTDEWIRSRTGIKQRHISSEEETTAFMASQAAQRALKEGNLSPEKIDLIIVATTTPNKIFPSVASEVGASLGCNNIAAFDLQAVCSGFLYAYVTAVNMMQSNSNINHVLVIGSERMSSILDWNDRASCVLFGDGAGAVLLTKNSQFGYIDSILKSDGSLGNILYANNHIEGLKMNGRAVFAHATNKLAEIIRELCATNQIDLAQIDHFIIHQANIRILQFLAEKLKIDCSKMPASIESHANTSAASIPLLLNEYKANIKNGDLILMAAAGAGFTWGAALLRF